MQFFSKFEIKEELIVYETPLIFVFLSYKPFQPFHLLISPKKCVKLIQELSEEEVKEFFEVARKMSYVQLEVLENFYETKFDNKKYYQSLIIQNGEDAGQSVSHLHLHINFIKKEKLNIRDKKILEDKILDDENRLELPFSEIKRQTDILRKFIYFYKKILLFFPYTSPLISLKHYF